MLDYALLLLFHCGFWFIAGVLSAIVHHKSGAMKISTAFSVGVISFSMHAIAIHFGWVSF